VASRGRPRGTAGGVLAGWGALKGEGSGGSRAHRHPSVEFVFMCPPFGTGVNINASLDALYDGGSGYGWDSSLGGGAFF